MFYHLIDKLNKRRNKYMVNEERKLSECRCISNDDKEVLLDALDVRRNAAISASTKVRLPESIERIEARLDKVEKMMETIKKIPTC